MSGIFIRYRRDDTAGHADRLFDHLCREFGDDGAEGTVAAAAFATAMDGSLAAERRPARLSMRYLYEKSKRHDEIAGEGTYLETTIYIARQFGAPPEEMWPYQSLSRKLPTGVTWADLDTAASKYKAQISEVADVDGILGALDKGTPVVVGAKVMDYWDSAATSGLIKPAATAQLRGSTAITIVAYDPGLRRFKFANNWGTAWGDKGYGYFDRADAKSILSLENGIWSVKVPPATEP